MGRPKRRKLVGAYRVVFGEALQARLDTVYPDAGDKPAAFVNQHGTGIASKSTINRWLNGEVSPNLDQIEAVAKALKTSVRELLTPEAPQPEARHEKAR